MYMRRKACDFEYKITIYTFLEYTHRYSIASNVTDTRMKSSVHKGDIALLVFVPINCIISSCTMCTVH